MDMHTLKRTASLAKVNIDGQEEAMLRDFSAMAAYGARLGAVNAAVVTTPGKAVPLREDVPGQSLAREKALMNAPEAQGEFIAAPRAFD